MPVEFFQQYMVAS